MKNNIVLGGIFVLLLGFTYFYQEKKSEEAFQEALTKDHIISDVHELKLPNVTAIKKDGIWWQGERRLSANNFKIIEKKFTEIKKLKDVVGEHKNYFSDSLSIEVNGEKWIFGDLSFDRQGFYLSRDGKVILATMEGENLELVQDEHEVAPKKYEEFKFYLKKPTKELFENQLFRFYSDVLLTKVVIEAYERLPYEIDFKTNATLPPPIPGIRVHEKLREKFNSLLTQITIKDELPYSDSLKFKKMGIIKLIGENRTVVWELWLTNDKTADAVIIDPEAKKAFQMIGGTLRVYFTMVQDYWDKKVIPPDSFKSFERLQMLLSQGDESLELTVLNQEPLKFESRRTLNEENLMGLINIIFNLGNYDQADRVSLLSKSERKMLMNESLLRVMVMDQELILWGKAEELIVVNLTQGFKSHFPMLREKQGMQFKDMVK